MIIFVMINSIIIIIIIIIITIRQREVVELLVLIKCVKTPIAEESPRLVDELPWQENPDH